MRKIFFYKNKIVHFHLKLYCDGIEIMFIIMLLLCWMMMCGEVAVVMMVILIINYDDNIVGYINNKGNDWHIDFCHKK
jgi:hypothetical protein